MERRHVLLLSALLGVFAPSQNAVSQPATARSSGKLPSNLSPTFPVAAIDHVVTYSLWRGRSPMGGDRVVLHRHGALVRADTDYIGSKRAGEQSDGEEYSNLATEGALSITRDDKGAVWSASITRHGPPDIPIYRHTIAATDAVETIAGERCRVWTAKPETNEGVGRTSCITTDGIVLRDTTLYHDGSVMEERRAIKIDRRQVLASEVLPPAEVLRWSRWAKRRAASLTGEGKLVNYDLTLVGKEDGEFLTKIIRKAGAWSSEQDNADKAARAVQIIGPSVTLSYYSRDYPLMSISRGKTSFLMDPGIFQSAPLNRPGDEIVGESCTWHNAAVNVSDYGRFECRTRDQVPIRRDEYSRGGLRVSWMATALRRGQTSPGSIGPPPSLMDWAFWGWPELSGR